MPTTPTAATLNVAHATAGPPPSSPPHTPTTLSPTSHRRGPLSSAKSRAPKNIQPLGNGKFSYARDPRREELSPQSTEDDSSADESDDEADESEESEDEDDDIAETIEEDDDVDIAAPEAEASVQSSSDTDADSDGVDPDAMQEDEPPDLYINELKEVLSITWEIIECDPDDSESEFEGLDIIQPSGYEYPDEPREDLDPKIIHGVRDMKCFDSDEDSQEEDDEFMQQVRARRENKRLRRMTSGSISKRTVSERDSDSDDYEDMMPYEEAPIGTQRRMRRKTERYSITFLGGHFPSIQELKEPNSDDEISLDDNEVFRELPYFTYSGVTDGFD